MTSILLVVLFFLGVSVRSLDAKVTKWTSIASDSSGNFLLGSSGQEGLYVSKDAGESWTASSAPKLSWHGVASSSTGDKLAACALGNSIFLSGDKGMNWIRSEAPVAKWNAIKSSADGQYLYATALREGIYRSVNGGQTWEKTNSVDATWRAVTTDSTGKYVIAAEINGGVYRSEDFGATWVMVENVPAVAWFDMMSDATGQFLVAAALGNGVYTSNDFGKTWTKTSLADGLWQSVASDASGKFLTVVSSRNGNMLFAAADGQEGIYKSIDSGKTWMLHASQQAETENLDEVFSLDSLFKDSKSFSDLQLASLTDAPTSYPTGKPTSKPSSSRPTSQPSTQPTSMPSRQPSSQPTSMPSSMPSSQPSCQPSSHPSAQPSSQPTAQPTATATFKPTLAPWVTPGPTFAPTAQVQPKAKFNVSTTLSGGKSKDIPPAASDAIVTSIAQISNVKKSNVILDNTFSVAVTNETNSNSVQNSIKLEDMDPTRRRLGAKLLYYIYVFNCHIELNLVDYPSFNANATALVNDVKSKLEVSYKTGAINDVIKQVAANISKETGTNSLNIFFNATNAVNVTFSPITYTAPVVVPSHTNSNSKVSAGVIAGIVIGAIIGTACLWSLIYYVVIARRENAKDRFSLASRLENQQIAIDSPKLGDKIISGFADDAMIIYLDNDLESSIYRQEAPAGLNERAVSHRDIEIRI